MNLQSTSCTQVEVSVTYSICFLFVWKIIFPPLNLSAWTNVSERVKLKRSDYPLVLRVIQGPCEQVCKVFLMEEDLGEEVTYDVNHHISFVCFSF